MERKCDAGRRASFGGRWQTPCEYDGNEWNILAVGPPETEEHKQWGAVPGREGEPPLLFCPEHMKELIDAGLVEQPNLTPEEKALHEEFGASFNTGGALDD